LIETDLPKILQSLNPIINETLQNLITEPLSYTYGNLTISGKITEIPINTLYNKDSIMLAAYLTDTYNKTAFPLKSFFPV